jgi:integrase
MRGPQLAKKEVGRGAGSVGDLFSVYGQELGRRVDIKPSTLLYYQQISAAILRSWPELASKDVRSVRSGECQAWAARYAKTGSSTRYNNAVDHLRNAFALAIREKTIFENPAASLGKRTPTQKHLELPDRQSFRALVSEIRSAGGRFSEGCADLVEFLAFSGLRVSEARALRWEHVEDEFMWIHGPDESLTKNRTRRQVPIVPELKRLLADLKTRDYAPDRLGFVLNVREAQKALDRACGKLGIKRITHHDLRHLFASSAIESGVDIPTVSRWLGHRDGGALAMKTYGHLRIAHSLESAKKVQF